MSLAPTNTNANSSGELQKVSHQHDDTVKDGATTIAVFALFMCAAFTQTAILTDPISERGIMQSPPSVRLSVRLFPLYLRNRLTVELELLLVSRS